MNKKLLHKKANTYNAPALEEMAVRVEVGFALSDSLLEDIPELDSDGGF